MRRRAHENVATVLVDPRVLIDLELSLMERDLRVWPIHTAPICLDGSRTAFQVRRTLLIAKRGAWDCAAEWIPVWVSFGETWHHGEDPLPWAAHEALWHTLEAYADQVRYEKRLSGVRPLMVAAELTG